MAEVIFGDKVNILFIANKVLNSATHKEIYVLCFFSRVGLLKSNLVN